MGEISLALEEVWARHRPSTAVVRGAYGASYNESDEVILEYRKIAVIGFQMKTTSFSRVVYSLAVDSTVLRHQVPGSGLEWLTCQWQRSGICSSSVAHWFFAMLSSYTIFTYLVPTSSCICPQESEYKGVLRRVEQFAEEEGRRPRILVRHWSTLV